MELSMPNVMNSAKSMEHIVGSLYVTKITENLDRRWKLDEILSLSLYISTPVLFHLEEW